MLLEYDLTTDDFVALNLHAATTSPTIQTSRARSRVWGSVGVFVGGLLLVGLEGSWLEALVVASLGSAVFWFVWPPTWSWFLTRNVRRLARAGGLGVPGRCRLWIDEDGVHDQTPTGSSSVAWSGVVRLDETDTHAFIYVGPVQAYVIPRRIGEPAVQAFINAARVLIGRGRTS